VILTACGGSPPATPAEAPATQTTGVPAPQAAAPAAGAGKTLRFSSYTWSGYEQAMKQVLDMWKKENPGVEIQTEFVGEDYWTKVQTQVAAGTPPDVGIADYGRTVSFAKGGVLLPLDDYIAVDKFPLEQFLPEGVAQYRWQQGAFDSGGKSGKIYGLPSDAQGHILAYNKKMFDDAGVKYPSNDWTWNDLVQVAKQITKADQNKWGIAVPGNSGLGTLYRGNFVYAAGGSLTTPDYKKSALDMPETIEAYKWMWDLIYTHKVAPRPVPSQQVEPFASGQVAMTIGGIWMIADWKEIKDFGWDIALFPKHPRTGKRTTSLESDGWWAFKASKNPQLAWSLVKFMASQTGQKKFAELDFVVPPSIPAVGQAWHDKKPPEHRALHLQSLVNDSKKVNITFFEQAKIVGALDPVIQKAFFDGADITKQMQEAAKIMNDELAKAWEKFNEA
jgi:multiple sugar transport system substrate-binding protein